MSIMPINVNNNGTESNESFNVNCNHLKSSNLMSDGKITLCVLMLWARKSEATKHKNQEFYLITEYLDRWCQFIIIDRMLEYWSSIKHEIIIRNSQVIITKLSFIFLNFPSNFPSLVVSNQNESFWWFRTSWALNQSC